MKFKIRINYLPLELTYVPTFQYSNIPWLRQIGEIFLNTLQLSLVCRDFEL